jgi:hypothetical protein
MVNSRGYLPLSIAAKGPELPPQRSEVRFAQSFNIFAIGGNCGF